jgi:putative (di)nucleoside polyphosphate hydrolase
MPQGGVHDGEKRKETLMRELKEELGTDKFKVIKRFPFSHQYDWDEETIGQTGFKWRGQKQTFFLVEFVGKDSDIKLDTDELKDWCWATEKKLFEKIDKESIFLKNYKKLVEKLLKAK